MSSWTWASIRYLSQITITRTSAQYRLTLYGVYRIHFTAPWRSRTALKRHRRAYALLCITTIITRWCSCVGLYVDETTWARRAAAIYIAKVNLVRKKLPSFAANKFIWQILLTSFAINVPQNVTSGGVYKRKIFCSLHSQHCFEHPLWKLWRYPSWLRWLVEYADQ